MLREKTDLKMARTSAAIAGRLCEGHVAMRNATRRASKQKRRLLRFPGYYQYSNEIALIRAGLM